MGFWLLVFFFTPILEMYLLIRVGGYIGAWPTVGLVALTAVLGVSLLRVQGLATLTRGMSRLEGGELPAREVVEGLLLAVAGVLLLAPGFLTDGLGFLLLLPVARGLVAKRMLARVVVVGPEGELRSPRTSHRRPPGAGGRRRGDRGGIRIPHGSRQRRRSPPAPLREAALEILRAVPITPAAAPKAPLSIRKRLLSGRFAGRRARPVLQLPRRRLS